MKMKKITEKDPRKNQTLISPSPNKSFSSSSSSDFEFTVSISPRKSSNALCPADELFCNGHLLPLHHSRRVSSVRTILSSSSTSSSATSRDSSGSSNDSRSSSSNSNSSRPSLVNEEDGNHRRFDNQMKKTKNFSFSRFSSVFRKESKNNDSDKTGLHTVRTRVKGTGFGFTAKEVIKKYFKKVQQKMGKGNPTVAHVAESGKDSSHLVSGKSEEAAGRFSISFSGNLRYPRGRSGFLPSCPSSTRSSPSHPGMLRRRGAQSSGSIGCGGPMFYTTDMSSMEELQSSIQGAIAHCKNSLIHNKNITMINNDMIL